MNRLHVLGLLVALMGLACIGTAIAVGFLVRPDSVGQLELVIAGLLGSFSFLGGLLVIGEADA